MKSISFVKYFFTVLAVLFFFSSTSQIISFPANSNQIDPASEGIYYTLPLNKIRIDVQVKKTEKFKGKFSDYATKLLGITDYISKDAISYEISNVEISTETYVDSLHVYYLQLPSNLKENSFIVNLSDQGFISGFENKNRDSKNIPEKELNAVFRDLLKPVQIEKVDTIVRKVNIDTALFEERILRRSISEKSNEQQAKEIADLIYKIEDSKYSLLTGYLEVNYSKDALQYMINKLNSVENEYLAFFKGAITESFQWYTFYYTPDNKAEESISSLFRFSSNEGIADKFRQTGEMVTFTVKPEQLLMNARNTEIIRSQAKRKGKGLYYRIPESAIVELKLGNTLLKSDRCFISQMGILTFLPVSGISSVEFNANGSIKTISIE